MTSPGQVDKGGLGAAEGAGGVPVESGAVTPLSASEINDFRLLAILCRRNNQKPEMLPIDLERLLLTIVDREMGHTGHKACFDLMRNQVNELVLALMWCKPRLKQEAYQKHIEWTLTKYPKPPRAEEPRIIRSDDIGAEYTDPTPPPVESTTPSTPPAEPLPAHKRRPTSPQETAE